MSVIKINGKTYKGRSVQVVGNKVIIDGKPAEEVEEKNIYITVEGNVDKLDIENAESLIVKGNVGKLKTMSGDVEVDGDVTGDIKTMSGDVRCGNVGGKIKTLSGDVKHARV